MKPFTALALAAALGLPAGPAAAQLVVHDPTSYGSLIRQATTALDQLRELQAQVLEARRLYDGFNTASGAGGLAQLLAAPQLRGYLPDAEAFLAAAGGDLSGLGDIGRRAAEIRAASRLFAAAADDIPGQDLERQGDRAARDLALGHAAVTAGARRTNGLDQLLAALDTAPNARAVMDLQARLAAEQAHSLNDQMRLQGLAMTQAAEARLQAQQDRERSTAARRQRMQAYSATFQ